MTKKSNRVPQEVAPRTITWQSFASGSAKKLLLIISISVLVFVITTQVQKRSVTTGVAANPDPTTVVVADTDRPIEKKPDITSEYNVATREPRRIILPTISSQGFIQKVGLNNENNIAVPTNIHVAGWYIASAVPGETGLSIIDGHVSGKYSDGIFKELAKLKTNDQFQIEYGDYRIRSFEIISVDTVSVEEASKLLFEKKPELDQQLNLITCGGRFDASNNSYRDRVIVISRAL